MEPDHYDTVLVAIVNSPKDWTIVCDSHWYRIPVRSAPKRGIHAPILAFYQTKAFGSDGWAIRHYALVREWKMLPRVQLLPDEPTHPRANELYYQLCLESVLSLPHPIVSREWKRITFLVTHWQRLLDAREISELLHGTIWEERLWRALRRIGRLAEREEIDDW